MADSITYEKVMELIAETEKRIRKRWEDSDKRFDEYLKKEAEERKKSREEFDKKIGKISNTLGYFVEGLVEPKLLELFQKRGIRVTEIYHNVEIHGKGFDGAEIDLLLANTNYSIAVEVKTTLTVEDVKEHIRRLDRFILHPIRIVKNTILLGAVVGMRIAENADKYAYRKGLFVLKQKGEIVEIANDDNFQPSEWILSSKT